MLLNILTCWTPGLEDIECRADVVVEDWRGVVLVGEREDALFPRFGHAG